MTTKKIITTVALALLFITGKVTAQTVYVTENGKKYHAKNCDLAKTGKKGITLEEAKKKGFEPCKACKVEEAPKADKPKEAEKKDKPKTTKK